MSRKRSVTVSSHPKCAKCQRKKWNSANDKDLLKVLFDVLAPGDIDLGSISQRQWERIVDKYRDTSWYTHDPDRSDIEHRLKSLKRIFTLNAQLARSEGWSWDWESDMAIAPNDKAWEEKIRENPEYAKVKNKPFPQYSAASVVFGMLDIRIDECFSNEESQDEFIFSQSDSETDDASPISGSPLGMRSNRVTSSTGKRRRVSDSDDSASSGRIAAPKETRMMDLLMLQKQLQETQRENAILRDSSLTAHAKQEEAEMAEGLKKMKALPGLPRQYLAVGVTALQKKELRRCILMLDGEDLAVWLQQQYVLSMSTVNHALLPEITRDGPILSQPARTPPCPQSGGQAQEHP